MPPRIQRRMPNAIFKREEDECRVLRQLERPAPEVPDSLLCLPSQPRTAYPEDHIEDSGAELQQRQNAFQQQLETALCRVSCHLKPVNYVLRLLVIKNINGPWLVMIQPQKT